MSATLKPCPFCGAMPVVRVTVEEYLADETSPAGSFEARHHIQCDHCGIEQSEEYREETIAAWNRRADGWQPIENAPVNLAILIHVPDLSYYGNDGVFAGMLVDMGTGKRWMTFGWAIGRDLGPESRPVAWRPIPSPEVPA